MKFIPSRNVPESVDHPRLYEGVEVDIDSDVAQRLTDKCLGEIIKTKTAKSAPAEKPVKKSKTSDFESEKSNYETEDLLGDLNNG